jgi:hypothetical protein
VEFASMAATNVLVSAILGVSSGCITPCTFGEMERTGEA